MADRSRHNSLEQNGPVLVPAWNKADIEALGARAIPIIPDGEFYDETSYNVVKTVPMPSR